MSEKSSILIVEGSRTQAARLKLVLEAHDYPVTVVTDGNEALAAAHTQQPALIISGVALSGMDGYDMCAALKRDDALKHIPVVLLTALSDVDDLMRGLKAQVDYCIAKPYQEEELLSRISAIIGGLVRQNGQPGREQLEVLLRGERKAVTSDRLQLLRFLLSTYENYNAMLRQNRSLSTAQLQLKTQNQHLQDECERLQTALEKSPQTASSFSMNSAVEGETSEDRRILVVDDTVICRTLLTRFLEKLDYVADSVASGAEAVTAYQERRYAAILMDVQMPIMSGFEATIRIRQQEKASGAHVPVIAITAHTQPGDRDHCLAGGMDEYLPKPITLEALKRVLARSLPQFSIPATMNAPGVAPSSLLVEKG